MKRITMGVVLLAFLAGPLHAQEKERDKKGEDNPMLCKNTNEKQKENAEIDKRIPEDAAANPRGGRRAGEGRPLGQYARDRRRQAQAVASHRRAWGPFVSKLAIARMISVPIGAAVLFGIEHGLGVRLYVAIPLAIIAYLAVKVAIGLICGVEQRG